MNPRPEWNRLPLAGLLVTCLVVSSAFILSGKEQTDVVDPNDPTLRLFQAADSLKGGKLTDFYVVAGVYKDPAMPNQESQHILKVDYDKTKVFGKLQIVVRSVGKIHTDQMKAYTAKEFFEFGLADQAKFMKSEPGPFGKPGDMYLEAESDRPLHSVPITDEVRKTYEAFLTKFVLPALKKK